MQKQLTQWTPQKTRWLIYFLIACYLILFSAFWRPMLLAVLFSSACAPIVNEVRTRFHVRRQRVAYMLLGVILCVFVAVLVMVVIQLYGQIEDIATAPDAVAHLNAKVTSLRDRILTWANQQSYLENVDTKEHLGRLVTALTTSAQSFGVGAAKVLIATTPRILVELFIFILGFGALLAVQPRIWQRIGEALGLGDRGRLHFQRFEKVCALALGSVLLTGLVQASLVALGAALAGYDGLIMIFVVTMIFAMVPLLGAGSVPVLLALSGFVQGDVRTGIVMGFTAAVVGVADNILRAWLFSRAAKSNPVFSLISLLGGVAIFGFAGLFAAPVIEQLVMTYAFNDEGA